MNWWKSECSGTLFCQRLLPCWQSSAGRQTRLRILDARNCEVLDIDCQSSWDRRRAGNFNSLFSPDVQPLTIAERGVKLARTRHNWLLLKYGRRKDKVMMQWQSFKFICQDLIFDNSTHLNEKILEEEGNTKICCWCSFYIMFDIWFLQLWIQLTHWQAAHPILIQNWFKLNWQVSVWDHSYWIRHSTSKSITMLSF